MIISSPSTKKSGFTLVELLTVIAIIAVLMGILFPTVNAAIESAKKTQAKSDEQNLVTAVKAYYAEYGRYPVDPAVAAGDFTYGSGSTSTGGGDQSLLMNVLRYPYTATSTVPAIVSTLNPRKITFLEVGDAKNLQKSVSQQRQGISTGGKWLDPWGNEYAIKIDGDYDNSLTNPYGANKNAGAATLNVGVIAWTYGRDGQAGIKGAGDLKGSDDVISWQ